MGFKSPGFSLGPDQLDVLTELGYLYNSSLLPTFYAPALRSLQRVLSGGHVDPTSTAAHAMDWLRCIPTTRQRRRLIVKPGSGPAGRPSDP